MMMSVVSVIVGCLSWTLLWFAANGALMNVLPDIFKSQVERVDILLMILAYSVAFSLIAGYVTAFLAPKNPMKHVLALGLLQLTLGIVAQITSWNLLPVWYHLSFLALLIPGNLAGGKLRLMRASGGGAAAV